MNNNKAMKKIIGLSFFSGIFLFCFLMLPLKGHALTPANFEHKYIGTWEKTYDNFDDDGIFDETGDIIVRIRDVGSKGKVKSAFVKFSDGDKAEATGTITKKSKGYRLILNYFTEYTDSSYQIKGWITKKKITGKYLHYTGSDGQDWGGDVSLTVSS
jgi:hypothetical protein